MALLAHGSVPAGPDGASLPLSAAPMRPLQYIIVALSFFVLALDGFDVLTISFAAPGIAEDWGISPAALGAVLSMELFGMGVGSIVLGWVADRWGRRPTLLGCLMLVIAGMLLSATSHDIPQLAIGRVITGFGLSGSMVCGFAIAAEFSSAKRVGSLVPLVGNGYSVGAVVGGILVHELLKSHSWQSVFYVGAAATALMIPVVLILMPESIHWLAQRKRTADVIDQINGTLRWLGHQPLAANAVLSQRAESDATGRFREIVSPPMLRTTLPATLQYVFNVMTVYFVLKWVPKIVSDMGFTHAQATGVLVWANVGGMLGAVVIALSAMRLPVKHVTQFMMVSATIAVSAFGFSTPDLSDLSLRAFVAGFFCLGAVTGAQGILALAFPARMRALGSGIAVGMGRGSAALAAVMTGVMLQVGLSVPTVAIVLGSGSALAATTLLFLSLQSNRERDKVG